MEVLDFISREELYIKDTVVKKSRMVFRKRENILDTDTVLFEDCFLSSH